MRNAPRFVSTKILKGINRMTASMKQIQPEYSKKIQSENNYHKTGNNLNRCLILSQKTSYGTGQPSKRYKHHSKSRYNPPAHPLLFFQ